MGVRSCGFRKETRGGKPHLVIDFRYRDKNGRLQRYRRDAHVQTATAARAEAQRLMAMAHQFGTLETRQRSTTFAVFVEDVFKPKFLPTYRPSTQVRYVALLRQHVLAFFGSMTLDEIGHTELVDFRAKLAKRGVQVRGALNLVRTILQAALSNGALEEFPKFPKSQKQGKKLPDAPSDLECAAMLEASSGWMHTAIALALFAGLRMGEVRALEVRDVDFERRVLTVRRALSEDEVVSPKSGNDRAVPMVQELVEVLSASVKLKLPKARVVVTGIGTSPTRTGLLTRFKKMLARHDLKERSFHSLRHAFCSRLVRNGASVESVRLLAGHSNLAVTARYVHADAADLEVAISHLSPGNSKRQTRKGNQGETG